MIKRILFAILIFNFVLVICLVGVSGEFSVNKDFSSVNEKYAEGDLVKGVIKMNFSEHENEIFTAKFNRTEASRSTSLIDMFEKMNLSLGKDFFCNPINCKNDYSIFGGVDLASEPIQISDSKEVLGFKLGPVTDLIKEIRKFEFDVTSLDNNPSCTNQIYIDLFNDGIRDFYNTKHSGRVCEEESKIGGCFDIEDAGGVEELENAYFCEKIEGLPAAPGYMLSAVVKKKLFDPDDDAVLDMAIYNIDKSFGPLECDGGADAYFIGEGRTDEVSCIVNYSSQKTFDAFVCIKDKDGTENYEIKYEQEGPCGGIGGISVPSSITTDFEIYVQPLMYAPIESLRFDKSLYEKIHGTNKNLYDDVFEYINETYGSDCSGEGCIVPFSIWGDEQNVVIDGITVEYELESGLSPEKHDVFALSTREFTITSNGTVFDIEKMEFRVPNVDGKHEFELFLGGDKILNKTIDVDIGFDFTIGPRLVFIGQKTVFTAFTNRNVSSSSWNFGDGSANVTSVDNQAQHIYTNESEYVVEVTLNSAGATSTKKFKVIVGEAKASANATLNRYTARISKIRSDISTLPSWVKDKIKEAIDIGTIEAQINMIKNEFESLGEGTDEQYIDIVNRLLNIDVPYSIIVKESGTLPADVGFSYMDVGHIAEISGVEIVDAENTKSAIIAWINGNYDIDVNFDTYSVVGDFGQEAILTKYEVSLTAKTDPAQNAYLIINYPMTSMEFKSAYDQVALSTNDAAYVPVGPDYASDIEFLIVDSSAPSVESLRIYVSPFLNELDVGKPYGGYPEEGKFNWIRFLIGTAIVFVVFLAVYIILQSWYKRHYEKHLFKNPNNLYNIINFIYNSRKVGMADSDIRKKLLSKKWSREQITYAFKKIDGKRTGMWEIPLFKFAENRKVRKELERKQGGTIDVRFIKRPSL